MRLDTFGYVLDTRFGYVHFFWIRDLFGYVWIRNAKKEVVSKSIQNVFLDAFGYANEKTNENQNGYPKVSKHFRYVL